MSQDPKDKINLRQEMLMRRKALSSEFRQLAEAKILIFLSQVQELNQAPGVALYWAVGSEVSTQSIFGHLQTIDKKLYLPRSDLSAESLEMVEVHSPQDLTWGPFKTREPGPRGAAVGQEHFPIILIPGLAFDPQGGRLGRGRGYYDRFLSHYTGLKIGLAFSEQILPRLPTDPHDVPMDLIITEQGIHKI